jgi:hypothetical protein
MSAENINGGYQIQKYQSHSAQLAQAMEFLPPRNEIKNMLDTAQVLYQGGLLPDSIRSPQAAFTVMLKGRELGIPPMAAFSSINVIKGKPTLSADLMVALLRRAGHKVWVVTSTATECTMRGHRRDEPEHPVEVTFTMKDAERAGLVKRDKDNNPGMFEKFPAQMLYSRCAGRISRMIATEELTGIYTPEEMGGELETRMSEDGGEEFVEAEVLNNPSSINEQIPPAHTGFVTGAGVKPETKNRTAKAAQAFDDAKVVEETQPDLNKDQFADWLSRMGMQPSDVLTMLSIEKINTRYKELWASGDRQPLRTILHQFVDECAKPDYHLNFNWRWDNAKGEPVEAEDVPFEQYQDEQQEAKQGELIPF